MTSQIVGSEGVRKHGLDERSPLIYSGADVFPSNECDAGRWLETSSFLLYSHGATLGSGFPVGDVERRLFMLLLKAEG